MNLPVEGQLYTYSDYCTWDVDERYELIDGVPYLMAPGPSDKHQSISGELFGQLWSFLKGKTCQVRNAPYDVRLNPDDKDDNVVQPDIVVICDPSKIQHGGCVGAPDMVIEILSPSNRRHDHIVKLMKYEKFGVQEYWIADPEIKTVHVHILNDSKYDFSVYKDPDTVSVHVLEGCEINLSDVF